MRVTDRQTDGRTDRQTDRILIARPRLHYMQRGKNSFVHCSNIAMTQVAIVGCYFVISVLFHKKLCTCWAPMMSRRCWLTKMADVVFNGLQQCLHKD